MWLIVISKSNVVQDKWYSIPPFMKVNVDAIQPLYDEKEYSNGSVSARYSSISEVTW